MAFMGVNGQNISSQNKLKGFAFDNKVKDDSEEILKVGRTLFCYDRLEIERKLIF